MPEFLSDRLSMCAWSSYTYSDHGRYRIGARNGILIKGGGALEAAAHLSSIILDKTGTITRGTPEVTDVLGNEEVASLFYSLEYASEHPLGKAIVAYGETQGMIAEPITDFTAHPGAGISGKINGQFYFAGTRKRLEEMTLSFDEFQEQALELEGRGKQSCSWQMTKKSLV